VTANRPALWPCLIIAIVCLSSTAWAQDAQQTPADHRHGREEAADLFPAREASGTAWIPDATPMYGLHKDLGDWRLMFHGNVFAQFLFESGDFHRRGRQAGSINWIMGMARRQLGNGRLGVRLMASVEPWTLSGCGYPNLLATGEVCDGDTIHDRQHPHDLFMEIAGDYDRPITRAVRLQLYAGLAGEPALGPPSFPHRPSAFPNPIAPIGHHWLDSTHISFGLLTTALYGSRWKAEVSAFNGREPDETRLDLDLGPLDSVSGRVWYVPTSSIGLQLSAAHLNDAEEEFAPAPRLDVNRVTASATYHRLLIGGGLWATTLAYGVNSEQAVVPGAVIDQVTHALLLESSLTSRERHAWFGRFEVVGKPAHDLHVHEHITRIFTIGKLQGGYVRYFTTRWGLSPGIGGTISASLLPPLLAPRYNGRIAPGFGVFVTVHPTPHVR
jgi:hypothetical protein